MNAIMKFIGIFAITLCFHIPLTCTNPSTQFSKTAACVAGITTTIESGLAAVTLVDLAYKEYQINPYSLKSYALAGSSLALMAMSIQAALITEMACFQ